MLKSENLSYEKMKVEDICSFQYWGKHETPLLDDYNFYETTEEGFIDWFNWKTKNPLNKYMTIFKDGVPIGYIGYKGFNNIFKTATLGVVLDPNYVNKGYGQEAIITTMDYYFNTLNYKKINLKVARYNKRAIALYEKLGFEKVSTSILFYENGSFDDRIEDYRNNKECFLNIMGKTFFYADKMVINREKFDGVIKCISNFKI